jgi:hypothetical protein
MNTLLAGLASVIAAAGTARLLAIRFRPGHAALMLVAPTTALEIHNILKFQY